jgi:hypothetical protein
MTNQILNSTGTKPIKVAVTSRHITNRMHSPCSISLILRVRVAEWLWYLIIYPNFNTSEKGLCADTHLHF